MEIPDVPLDVAARDPRLCSLMEQRLMLWLHVGKCYRRYKRQRANRIDDESKGPCNSPDCNFMIGLYDHMQICDLHQAAESCTSPHCKVMRRLIGHWRSCFNYDCPICGAKAANRKIPLSDFRVAPAKEWHQHHPLTEDQRQHAVRLLLQFMHAKPTFVTLVRRVAGNEAEKYFEADSPADYYQLLAENIWNMEMEKKRIEKLGNNSRYQFNCFW